MAIILKMWRQSVHIYLKNNRTILPNFIPIQFDMTEFRAFLKRLPQQEQEQQDG